MQGLPGGLGERQGGDDAGDGGGDEVEGGRDRVARGRQEQGNQTINAVVTSPATTTSTLGGDERENYLPGRASHSRATPSV